jgi:hypothetical protein
VVLDGYVVQMVTNCHKVLIDHHSQEEVVQYYKKCEKINLCDTAFISYGLAVCLDVHQHLWESDEGEIDVNKEQI